jgi:hypothetical protein
MDSSTNKRTGSPLSPVIANFFLEDFEKQATEQATHKPVCWFRYVDDTFVIWPHGKEKLIEFLNHLNRHHNAIQLTMEREEQGHLPFLDIDIYRKTDGSTAPNGTMYTGNPPIPISTYTRIRITILLINSPRFPDTQSQRSVTKTPSHKNWNISPPS